jgi:hypothetical protein
LIGPSTVSRRAAVALLLAASLAGCSGGITASDVVMSPGRWDVYNCSQLETTARSMKAREIELAQLMARSAQGPGGEFVNIIAYRAEYEQARASVKSLAETAAQKNCAGQSKWSSERSLF